MLFKLSPEQLERLIEASQPVPYMIIGGVAPRSPTSKAERVWQDLGKEMGFDWGTVKPIDGFGQEFFSAEPLKENKS